MIENTLTKEQLTEVTRRHNLRDVAFMSEFWSRHCQIGWRLHCAGVRVVNLKD